MSATSTARRTSYRGIMMRSRLEARYAAWLDRLGCEWVYEPCAFAGPAGQYLPDFRLTGVWLENPSAPVYVEVKPDWPSIDVRNRMEVVWESEPEAILAIEVDRGEREAGTYWVGTKVPRQRGYARSVWVRGIGPHDQWVAWLSPLLRRGWAYEGDA